MVQKKENVSWYHNLPLAECLGIMCHADILINLGNKSTNQTPSKVFDYIGTGNPIVNFHSLPDDTSKFYLEKYPMKLNILETENALSDCVDQFVAFSEEFVGKSVPRETLKEIYNEYDSKEVTSNTLRIIEDFLQARRSSDVEN